jgi:hypothetical protein
MSVKLGPKCRHGQPAECGWARCKDDSMKSQALSCTIGPSRNCFNKINDSLTNSLFVRKPEGWASTYSDPCFISGKEEGREARSLREQN